MIRTIGDLIAELKRFPDDFILVQASDPEGNDFHLWYDVGVGVWNDDAPHGEEFSSSIYDDPDDLTTERSITRDEANCVCLWP